MIFAPICAARAPPWERYGFPDAISGVCAYLEKFTSFGLGLVSLLEEIVVLLGNELKLG